MLMYLVNIGARKTIIVMIVFFPGIEFKIDVGVSEMEMARVFVGWLRQE